MQINYGIKTGFNEAFIIDGKKKEELIAADPRSDELIRPILRGRDIKRYSYEFADLWLINAHNGISDKGICRVDVSKFPAIKSHLDNYYEILEKRYDKGDTPYNLRSCAYMEDFYKQKIMWGEISDVPKFTLDSKGLYTLSNKAFVMTGESLKFLLGFLNSKLCKYYFSTIATTTGVGTVQWLKYKVEILPIPRILQEEQSPFIILIDEILAQRANLHNSAELENTLDKMIYNLYGFSKEEIHLIETGA